MVIGSIGVIIGFMYRLKLIIEIVQLKTPNPCISNTINIHWTKEEMVREFTLRPRNECVKWGPETPYLQLCILNDKYRTNLYTASGIQHTFIPDADDPFWRGLSSDTTLFLRLASTQLIWGVVLNRLSRDGIIDKDKSLKNSADRLAIFAIESGLKSDYRTTLVNQRGEDVSTIWLELEIPIFDGRVTGVQLHVTVTQIT